MYVFKRKVQLGALIRFCKVFNTSNCSTSEDAYGEVECVPQRWPGATRDFSSTRPQGAHPATVAGRKGAPRSEAHGFSLFLMVA